METDTFDERSVIVDPVHALIRFGFTQATYSCLHSYKSDSNLLKSVHRLNMQ